MPIEIGICDDSSEDIKLLSEALYAYDPTFKIKNYKDGQSLLEDCCEHRILFDIIFLDIYMPGLNGIDTARKIRSYNKEVKIIFVSSSNDHYPEAFNVFAFNYILKPISRVKLNSILDQALIDIKGERRKQISFSFKGITYRVFCRDILYVESQDKIIYLYMEDGNKLQCYSKLDDMLKQLPEESFIRCHQSFAVNIYHITEMAENSFRIGSAFISISKKHLKAAKEKYFNYLFTHIDCRRE